MTATVTINSKAPNAKLSSAQTGTPKERIVLPLPPTPGVLSSGQDTRFEMELYARFMRHLRDVPNSRAEIKILAAIQFTADMLDLSDALVAKTLVDLGLRAPRKAFPVAFLDFCDKCILRRSWDHDSTQGGPPPAVAMLKNHWDGIGEDRFGPLPVHYAVFNEGVTVN